MNFSCTYCVSGMDCELDPVDCGVVEPTPSVTTTKGGSMTRKDWKARSKEATEKSRYYARASYAIPAGPGKERTQDMCRRKELAWDNVAIAIETALAIPSLLVGRVTT